MRAKSVSVRLNDTTIHIRGQNVTIDDTFDDMTEKEANKIVGYLVKEGFLKADKDVNVTLKSVIVR